MLPLESLLRWFTCRVGIVMSHMMLPVLFLLPLIGCSNDGAGGSVISSVSSPTDTEADVELGRDQLPTTDESTSGEDLDPIITTVVAPDGVTAHMTWEPPSGFNAAGYSIHYEKHASEEPPSQESSSEEMTLEESRQEDSIPAETSACAQGESLTVTGSSATIAGLEPDTRYIFVIQAFNETDNLCSNEIAAVTPPAQF